MDFRDEKVLPNISLAADFILDLMVNKIILTYSCFKDKYLRTDGTQL